MPTQYFWHLEMLREDNDSDEEAENMGEQSKKIQFFINKEKEILK